MTVAEFKCRKCGLTYEVIYLPRESIPKVTGCGDFDCSGKGNIIPSMPTKVITLTRQNTCQNS